MESYLYSSCQKKPVEYIVEECPVMKFTEGIEEIHISNTDTIKWIKKNIGVRL